MKGNSDPAATPRLVKKVTELTGLDPKFVKESGGRLETQAFLREEFRETGKLGSRYDPNVTAYDPFPFNPTQETNDPILLSIIAPTTTAMVNFVTQTVGWKTDARYNALSNEVARAWDRSSRNGAFSGSASATDLRVAVATDPKLRVVIAHGWADLSCPFMGSVLTVSQMPIMGDPTRVQVHEYPGGHMYYARTASSLALRKDVMEMVCEALKGPAGRATCWPPRKRRPFAGTPVGRPLRGGYTLFWRGNAWALALLGAYFWVERSSSCSEWCSSVKGSKWVRQRAS